MTAYADGVAIIKACERVWAMIYPCRILSAMCDEARRDFPDLAPELDAFHGKLLELNEHLLSAMRVLDAKADML